MANKKQPTHICLFHLIPNTREFTIEYCLLFGNQEYLLETSSYTNLR